MHVLHINLKEYAFLECCQSNLVAMRVWIPFCLGVNERGMVLASFCSLMLLYFAGTYLKMSSAPQLRPSSSSGLGEWQVQDWRAELPFLYTCRIFPSVAAIGLKLPTYSYIPSLLLFSLQQRHAHKTQIMFFFSIGHSFVRVIDHPFVRLNHHG